MQLRTLFIFKTDIYSDTIINNAYSNFCCWNDNFYKIYTMKKKENRVRIPEGVKELSASDYRKYARINPDAVEKYPETIKHIQSKAHFYKSGSLCNIYLDKTVIILRDIVEYMSVGKKKPKKYYLTSNIFYGGVHFAVRKKIVDMCKNYLGTILCKEIEFIKASTKTPVEIGYTYITLKNTTFDLDNKLSFWNKIFSDWLVENNIIPDDNVKYIEKITYEYQRGDSALMITIKKLKEEKKKKALTEGKWEVFEK